MKPHFVIYNAKDRVFRIAKKVAASMDRRPARTLRRTMRGFSGDRFVEPRLPFQAQFATAGMASDFLDGLRGLEADPNWAAFGYPDRLSYAFWAPRLCGLVCLKMVLDGLRGDGESVSDLTDEAVRLGGYTAYDETGALVDRGWYYAPLVELARSRGLQGRVFAPLSLTTVLAELVSGHHVVCSVHPRVIRGDVSVLPPGQSGGHLVVVVGLRWERGRAVGLFVHNPSGRTRDTQETAYIPMARFLEAFAGRGFSIWDPQRQM